MARDARLVLPGLPHHVVHRARKGRGLFFSDAGFGVYLDLLEEQSERFRLRVLGYCLMPDHVRLVAIPSSQEALAKAVGQTHYLYTRYLRGLRKRRGDVWHGRFESCALARTHLDLAMRMVERYPVRAGIVRVAWRYRWSSAAAHTGLAKGAGGLDVGRWRKGWEAEEWREALREPLDESQIRALDLCTSRGRPWGTDRFVRSLERRLGRRLHALPPGRPRKDAAPQETRKK